MKRRGITQKDVAALANVHPSMVSKVVHGRAVSQPVVYAIRLLLAR